MKNNFVLTEKSNVIIRKILKSLSMLIVVFLCIVYLKHFSTSIIYLLLLSELICLIILYSFKTYRVIGNFVFDSNKMIIETNNQTIKLPFHTIRRIKFIFRGQKRTSYLPSVFQPIGVNMVDGTGNIIEIETEDNNYKFDAFLQNSFDANSLEFQIKKLADSGLKIDRRKLPTIVGDSI